MVDKNKKLNVSPSKEAIEKAKDDPYYKKLAKRRAERLAKTRAKLSNEPMPEKETSMSKEDYIKKTNKPYIDSLRQKRIRRAKDKLGKDE